MVRWLRTGVYGSGAMLVLTGTVWLALHYSVGAGAGELPHPLEAWSLRLHGLATFAGLFMLGALASAHVPHGWRLSGRPRWAHQRWSGLMLCILTGIMALTGYLLFYFAPETVRPALGWAHAFVGLLGAGLLLGHRGGVRSARDPGAARRPRPADGRVAFFDTVSAESNERQSHSHMNRKDSEPPMLLNELPNGARATVARVVAASAEVDAVALRRLGELGFIPGEPLQLLRRGPGGREPLAVLIGETMFGLRLLEAQCIEVDPA